MYSLLKRAGNTSSFMANILYLHTKKSAAAILLVILMCSCAIIPRNEYRPVAKGDDWRVRLVKYSSGSEFVTKGGFEHPFDISRAKLNNLLASIYVREANVIGKKGKQQVFPPKVRQILLDPIREAFSKAQPDEVIDFSFLLGKSFMLIFNHDLFTSGIMFRKNGKLNIVMRVVNYQCDNYQTAVRQFVSDPTSRALKNEWEFVLMPGMSLKKHHKKGIGFFQQSYYSNWLILDTGRVYRPRKTTVKHFERIITQPAPVTEKPEEETTPVDYGRSQPAHARPANQGIIDNPEARRKLQILRELYNSGAISRTTYERKKEEILSP